MNSADAALHALLGVAGGILSGLVGLGGGILLAPLLLYMPPLVGSTPLAIREVSGLTLLTSLATTLLGVRLHRERVERRLALPMGASVALGSFLGAASSRALPGRAILAILAALATVGGIVVLSPGDDRSASRRRHATLGATLAGAVGLLGGAAGQSGAFLVAPILVGVLGVPLRESVGTCLAVTAASAAAGALGKAATRQIPWPLAPPLLAGSLLGTWLGAMASSRLPQRTLRAILGAAILLGAGRMALDVVRAAAP